MGNSVRKVIVVPVTPADSTAELFHAEAIIPNEVGRGRAKNHRRLKCKDIIPSLHILTALIGNLNSPHRKLSRAGLLFWLLNMVMNFTWDGYESRAKYGYAWMCVRGLLWVTCCVGTWLTIKRTMPWLERELEKLERDKRYRKVLRDMAVTTEKLPYCLALFSMIAGSLQYGIMRKDQATNLAFGHTPNVSLDVILNVLRFISGVHVFYALALFWSLPMCVMLMVGYSMIEFQELTRAQLKIKECPITLKQAVESFNERVQFVKDSSSSCVAILCMLMVFTVISLAVNAYTFLFLHRSLFLHIVHALLPLVLAAYPLSTASWVTKQYHWHLVAVVKAWVEVSDSEYESDDEQRPNTSGVTNVIQRSLADRSEQQAPDEAALRVQHVHMPDTGTIKVKPYSQADIDRFQNVFIGSARFIGKLQYKRKFQKFQFEKYISYLEKVSRNVGFSIGVVLVTWELVSAVFFFLISVIALFVQESIFGKAESTIKI